jgi:hypothetical protein
MLVSVNRFLAAERRRLAITLSVLAVATVVVAGHSAISGDHMGMGTAACLAIVDSAAIAAGLALAVRVGSHTPVRGGRVRLDAPAALVRRAPEPRARPGPAVLQVFRR